MMRTMTVDLCNELRSYDESLLMIEQICSFIDEGEASGKPVAWNIDDFFVRMNNLSGRNNLKVKE